MAVDGAFHTFALNLFTLSIALAGPISLLVCLGALLGKIDFS